MADNIQCFSVLYTHQKTKKDKSWKDGLLSLRCLNGFFKATLTKEGKLVEVFEVMESLKPGSEFSSPIHLIQIDDQIFTETSLSTIECHLPVRPFAPRISQPCSRTRPSFATSLKYTYRAAPYQLPSMPSHQEVTTSQHPPRNLYALPHPNRFQPNSLEPTRPQPHKLSMSSHAAAKNHQTQPPYLCHSVAEKKFTQTVVDRDNSTVGLLETATFDSTGQEQPTIINGGSNGEKAFGLAMELLEFEISASELFYHMQIF